jgi:UDP-glucose 4-epimerase
VAKKILITGGAGFIGSTVADTFLGAGWEVAVVDDLSSGRRENVPAAARFYPCDVRSAAAAEVVERERPDVLCHHAAQIDVRRSMTDPRLDADVNLGGLLNLMQAAVRAGSVKQVLFASSGGATYGDTPVIPTPEGHPQRPVSSYGAAKAASELYLGVYQASYGIPFAALRYANVYGPRQDPHGEAGVVAIFCGRLLDGKPCTIYGDGAQTRDYVFVADVARANLLAAQRGFAGALNIGTGVETDVLQLYAALSRAAGSAAPPVHAEGRLGEQRRSCIDSAAAGRALGWKAEVDVERGLARTFQFFKARRG